MVRKIEAEERYFMEKLPPEDLQRFQTLSDLKARLSSDGEEALFSTRFAWPFAGAGRGEGSGDDRRA